MTRTGLLAFGVLAAAGCARVPHARPLAGQPVASARDAQWHWERREDPAHLRTAIALYEQGFERQPSVALANRLCRAYFLLADYFMEGDPSAQEALYAKGYSCAFRALKLQGSFAAAVGDRAWPTLRAIALVDPEHAESLLWWAINFGRWFGNKNALVQLPHLSRFLAAVERVQQLDDTILLGSLYRTWGAYYANRRDKRRALEAFEHAARLAPGMILSRTMCARDCGVAFRDKALFVRQLQLALAEKEPDEPEITPEFRMEQSRAKRLLARTDEFFPPR